MSFSIFFPILLILSCQQTYLPPSLTTSDAPQKWQDLLKQVVHGNRIDYQLLRQNRSTLDQYMAWVATHGPLTERYSIRDEKKKICYYVNAYNAAVLYGVLHHWPIQSVQEVDAGWFQAENTGFFLGQLFLIDGDYTTLFHLEHDLLLGQFQDPRIHGMLNCASKGCPALRYWKIDDLGSTLDQHWGEFIQKNTKKSTQGWVVSELFIWYQKDLLDWSHASNLCSYLAPYLKEETKEWMLAQQPTCSISSFPYDWSLND